MKKKYYLCHRDKGETQVNNFLKKFGSTLIFLLPSLYLLTETGT